MNEKYSYDEKCEELAEYFLTGKHPEKPYVRSLAQHIQDAVEAWLESEGIE